MLNRWDDSNTIAGGHREYFDARDDICGSCVDVNMIPNFASV